VCNIDIIDGGGWGQGFHSRRWHSIGIDDVLHMHLLFFFIEVTEDDDFVIAGWPMEPTVEVDEESFGELLVLRSVNDEIFLI
jgi:hypothetical protein